MRYQTALLLLLFAAPAFGQSRTEMAVYLASENPVPASVLSAMEQEVESALEASGVRLIWAHQSNEVYSRIAVVTMTGQCSPKLMVVRSKDTTDALGQTQVQGGHVLPFADVRCDAIMRVIGRDLRSFPSDRHDELLGRALGRVLSHELYHVLLRTERHAQHGLARTAQSSADLLGKENSFTAADEHSLRYLTGAAASGR